MVAPEGQPPSAGGGGAASPPPSSPGPVSSGGGPVSSWEEPPLPPPPCESGWGKLVVSPPVPGASTVGKPPEPSLPGGGLELSRPPVIPGGGVALAASGGHAGGPPVLVRYWEDRSWLSLAAHPSARGYGGSTVYRCPG